MTAGAHGTGTRDPDLVMRTAGRILADVRAGVAAAGGIAGEAALVPLVQAAAAAAGAVLGIDDTLAVTARVGAELWGLGPLQPLVEAPDVTDVLVNGPDDVWVDTGDGLVRVPCAIGAEEDVRQLATRLASAAGRRLDDACPYVDARLPGGIRLNAVLPPVAPGGTLLSLRLLRRDRLDLDGLEAAGSIPPGWLAVLQALVDRRVSFLVSGGTGAGKTTLLAALLARVPESERIVLVEDVGELYPRHPHVVRLEARHPNVEGRGAVTLEDLVRQALRMRPDRLVVGECRGGEVRDLLAALNTGHSGGCGTVHANAPEDVPARLEALGSLAGMSPGAVHVQAAAALDVVVHLQRTGPVRKVVAIAGVSRTTDGRLDLAPALTVPVDGGSVGSGPGVPGRGWPLLARRLGWIGAPP